MLLLTVIIGKHLKNAGYYLKKICPSTICQTSCTFQGATTSEIKKAYRRLSAVYHPDRDTGDAVKFMRISKAHQAYVCIYMWQEYNNNI